MRLPTQPLSHMSLIIYWDRASTADLLCTSHSAGMLRRSRFKGGARWRHHLCESDNTRPLGLGNQRQRVFQRNFGTSFLLVRWRMPGLGAAGVSRSRADLRQGPRGARLKARQEGLRRARYKWDCENPVGRHLDEEVSRWVSIRVRGIFELCPAFDLH